MLITSDLECLFFIFFNTRVNFNASSFWEARRCGLGGCYWLFIILRQPQSLIIFIHKRVKYFLKRKYDIMYKKQDKSRIKGIKHEISQIC